MADDIRQFVKNCETCQRVNDAKFVKVYTALHPIPVKLEVRNRCHTHTDDTHTHSCYFAGIHSNACNNNCSSGIAYIGVDSVLYTAL